MPGRRARRRLSTTSGSVDRRVRRALNSAWIRVAQDRTSGASAIGRSLLALLARELRLAERTGDTTPAAVARELARRLDRVQPAMAAPRSLASEFRRAAQFRTWQELRGLVRHWRLRLDAELTGTLRVGRATFPPEATVVTISRSETVGRLLRELPPPRRPKQVVVVRSLPGGEGARFARELRAASVRARVIPDSRGAEALRTADVLLIGADAVYRDGSVAHKVGTRALAREAVRRRVPVVCVAVSSKWTPAPAPRRAPSRLFDITPARWIDAYVTDRGVRLRGQRDSGAGRSVPKSTVLVELRENRLHRFR